MRRLRRVGLVFSLLIVGVLGGLMAPVPSDAVNATLPTISITVTLSNGTTTTNQLTLLAPVTCPSGGPNYCYPIRTYNLNSTLYGPPNRQFKVENVVNTPGARLNITDFATTSNTLPSDAIVLTDVQFVPVVTGAGWPSNEKVVLKVTVRNKFDAQPNPQANGTTTFFPFGMTVGGKFASSPSPIGDISQVWGTGIFVTAGVGTISTTGQPKRIYDTNTNFDADTTFNASACTNNHANKSPLCKTVASPGGEAQLTFSAGQSSNVYPGTPTANPSTQRFACSNNLAAGAKTVVDPRGTTRNYTDPSCQPDITEVYQWTLFGPDSVVLSASGGLGGKVCETAESAASHPPLDPPFPLCDCTVEGTSTSACDSIASFVLAEEGNEAILNVGIPASVPCSTEICNGTLRTLIRVTPAPAVGSSFEFTGAGPRIEDFTITSEAGGIGEFLFADLITGQGGTDLTISGDTGQWPKRKGKAMQVDNIICSSLNGSTIIDTDTDNGIGDTKGPLIIHAIGNGDTLTCEWHIH